MASARHVALQWWTAREVKQVFPDEEATQLFLAWVEQHRLGRKRLLDTQLAATYVRAGITSLLTTNPGDFGSFQEFTCLVPANETTA